MVCVRSSYTKCMRWWLGLHLNKNVSDRLYWNGLCFFSAQYLKVLSTHTSLKLQALDLSPTTAAEVKQHEEGACGGIPGARSQRKVSSAPPALSEPPPSPTNFSTANLLWNLKNLICQHVSIICSITVRASGRGQRPVGGWEEWLRGGGVHGVGGWRAAGPKAAALGWEDGAVIRPSRWLELSRTA